MRIRWVQLGAWTVGTAPSVPLTSLPFSDHCYGSARCRATAACSSYSTWTWRSSWRRTVWGACRRETPAVRPLRSLLRAHNRPYPARAPSAHLLRLRPVRPPPPQFLPSPPRLHHLLYWVWTCRRALDCWEVRSVCMVRTFLCGIVMANIAFFSLCLNDNQLFYLLHFCVFVFIGVNKSRTVSAIHVDCSDAWWDVWNCWPLIPRAVQALKL